VADPLQDGLFREIDEELRQEHYAKLWKKYGTHIMAAALALVIGVAGYQGWRAYDIKNRQADSARFAEAQRLASAEKTDEARLAFARLASDAGGGYAVLARFREAALLARSADRPAAATAYRELADDTSVGPIYRDLAVVLGTLQALDDGAPAELTGRLAPLTADDNPWRHSAREITGLLALRTGDREKARQAFDRLTGDPATPRGIRGRATELLEALGD